LNFILIEPVSIIKNNVIIYKHKSNINLFISYTRKIFNLKCNWENHIFTLNNVIHEFTNETPFFINYGFHPYLKIMKLIIYILKILMIIL